MAESLSAEARARLSHGESDLAVRDLVVGWLDERGVRGGTLVDVGCGAGDLLRAVHERFDRSTGVDIVQHQRFPAAIPFIKVDLERERVPLADESADLVTCVETVEHLENPRALLRELARLVRADGWLLVTTPNQLSLASKLCLLLKNEFWHFRARPGLYPAHITALLEVDLRRMLAEVGLVDVSVSYSGRGRIPLTVRHWPRLLSRRSGALATALSDNVLVAGRKPASP